MSDYGATYLEGSWQVYVLDGRTKTHVGPRWPNPASVRAYISVLEGRSQTTPFRHAAVSGEPSRVPPSGEGSPKPPEGASAESHHSAT